MREGESTAISCLYGKEQKNQFNFRTFITFILQNQHKFYTMLHQSTISFLQELHDNNHTTWFYANRPRYEAARADMLKFTADLLQRLSEFDADMLLLKPADCMFRINRDVRFSKDKSPYKTNMGCYAAKGGKKSNYAGYYIHVEPTAESFFAGGLYQPLAPELARVRQEIDYQLEEWEAILHHPDFLAQYPTGVSDSNKLKNVPKGYEKDNPAAEWLKYKNYVVMHPITTDVLTSPRALDAATAAFRALYPMVQFLNRAIG